VTVAEIKPELVVSFDTRELRCWFRFVVKLKRTFDRLIRCRLVAEPRLCRRLDRLTDEFEVAREDFRARISTVQRAMLVTFPALKDIGCAAVLKSASGSAGPRRGERCKSL